MVLVGHQYTVVWFDNEITRHVLGKDFKHSHSYNIAWEENDHLTNKVFDTFHEAKMHLQKVLSKHDESKGFGIAEKDNKYNVFYGHN